MKYKNVLLLTDNIFLYKEFVKLLKEFKINEVKFEFACSEKNDLFDNYSEVTEISVKNDLDKIMTTHDLIFSLHCKQFFPVKLVKSLRCINIHPGYNPYNRGWYPQVFALLNDERIGATIHLMDEKLDHGDIIARKVVDKFIWDTSETLYNRILKAEIELIKDNLLKILDDDFDAFNPEFEGDVSQKKDFVNLCKLDFNQVGTFKEFYNLLRALTHGDYKNAHFTTEEGRKIFLKIDIKKPD